ncbi:trk system potassium uptake protein TrkA [Clostridium cavendishii DSM 21758]|uniref:Trk system potassium uptake protein TrkA n=1 Tax=Clostridium cavendishii DSM 21758 TaxID=1121302 RepID=A0A1M6KU64_9CLOT|nr:TrkA family potassium uptake protein [Clostridium cavendishii]SHJ62517.1 trk system potassium uptake protein TrkA [Clostridium cavendishii DSM 21758]
MSKKQFAIIGTGRFGSSVAKTLYNLGHDVLAIDIDEEIVNEMADYVTHAVQLDATDENALKAIGIRNFDVVVVTIGENIQSSIMTTLIVKETGVKKIIVKANSELHEKVLYKIGADRVILPEKEMGVRVANNLVSSSVLDYIELSSEYSVVEIETLKEWHNKTIGELSLRSKYGISVIAIKRNNELNISPYASDMFQPGDIIVALGKIAQLSKLDGKVSY